MALAGLGGLISYGWSAIRRITSAWDCTTNFFLAS
jgi:hypothetical protein